MHDDPFDDIPPELLATLDRVRARYGDTAPPVAGPVLSSFLSVGLTNDNGDLPVTAASNANEPAEPQVVGLPNWRTTLTQRRRQAMQTIGAFIGTTLGKVVLGATVAAASVGAGQASGVVDVNGDPAPTQQVVIDDEVHDDELDEGTEPSELEDADDAAEEIEEADEVDGDDGAVEDDVDELEADDDVDDEGDDYEVDDDGAEFDDDEADDDEGDDYEVDDDGAESDDDEADDGSDAEEHEADDDVEADD